MRGLLAGIALAVWVISPALAKDGVVYTVNYPLHYMADAIAGEELEIVFPVPRDVDPAYWRPGTEIVLAYQSADLILLNGAGYAKWTKSTVLPRSRLVDTSAPFRDRLIDEDPGTVLHIHGPEGDHVHDRPVAFTTWLDLLLARAQAEAVLAATTARWPEHATIFTERHKRLDEALAALDGALEVTLTPLKGRHVLASHPVYQYLARRYGLDLTAFHWEPNATPTVDQWTKLDALRDERTATVMLWEGEPTPETRSALEERGVRVAVFPTMANHSDAGDFVGAMWAAIDQLSAAIDRR
jgi:zinc transport system substrate-binding protein